MSNLAKQFGNAVSECNDQCRLIQNYLHKPFCHDTGVNLMDKFREFIANLDIKLYSVEKLTKLIRLLIYLCVVSSDIYKSLQLYVFHLLG